MEQVNNRVRTSTIDHRRSWLHYQNNSKREAFINSNSNITLLIIKPANQQQQEQQLERRKARIVDSKTSHRACTEPKRLIPSWPTVDDALNLESEQKRELQSRRNEERTVSEESRLTDVQAQQGNSDTKERSTTVQIINCSKLSFLRRCGEMGMRSIRQRQLAADNVQSLRVFRSFIVALIMLTTSEQVIAAPQARSFLDRGRDVPCEKGQLVDLADHFPSSEPKLNCIQNAEGIWFSCQCPGGFIKCEEYPDCALHSLPARPAHLASSKNAQQVPRLGRVTPLEQASNTNKQNMMKHKQQQNKITKTSSTSLLVSNSNNNIQQPTLAVPSKSQQQLTTTPQLTAVLNQQPSRQIQPKMNSHPTTYYHHHHHQLGLKSFEPTPQVGGTDTEVASQPLDLHQHARLAAETFGMSYADFIAKRRKHEQVIRARTSSAPTTTTTSPTTTTTFTTTATPEPEEQTADSSMGDKRQQSLDEFNAHSRDDDYAVDGRDRVSEDLESPPTESPSTTAAIDEQKFNLPDQHEQQQQQNKLHPDVETNTFLSTDANWPHHDQAANQQQLNHNDENVQQAHPEDQEQTLEQEANEVMFYIALGVELIVLLSILFLAVYFMYRDRQAAKEKLANSNSMISRSVVTVSMPSEKKSELNNDGLTTLDDSYKATDQSVEKCEFKLQVPA